MEGAKGSAPARRQRQPITHPATPPTCFSNLSVNWRGSASRSQAACASAASFASATACEGGWRWGGVVECRMCATRGAIRCRPDWHWQPASPAHWPLPYTRLRAALRGSRHQPRLHGRPPGQPHELGGGRQEGGVQHRGQVVLRRAGAVGVGACERVGLGVLRYACWAPQRWHQAGPLSWPEPPAHASPSPCTPTPRPPLNRHVTPPHLHAEAVVERGGVQARLPHRQLPRMLTHHLAALRPAAMRRVWGGRRVGGWSLRCCCAAAGPAVCKQ